MHIGMYVGMQPDKQVSGCMTGTQSTSRDNSIAKHKTNISGSCYTLVALEQTDMQSANQRLTLCYILGVTKLKHELIEGFCHLLQSKALVLWGG